MRVIIIIMNSWIERHIIFPKINEMRVQKEKIKEEIDIRTSIIKELKRKKNSSLYNLKEEVVEGRSKNLTAQKRKLKASPVKKQRNKCASYFFQDNPKPMNEVNGRSVKFINISELLEERKNVFQSSPLKSMLRKLKLEKLQPSCLQEKGYEGQCATEKKPKRRYIKSKLVKSKTEPKEQGSHILKHIHQDQYDSDCLQIKQVTKFDYHEIAKSIEAQKQLKRHNFLKKKQFQQLKETALKITSIKGWGHEQEQYIQYL